MMNCVTKCEGLQRKVQPLRIHPQRASVDKQQLLCLLTLRRSLRTQSQRGVGELHRLPYYPIRWSFSVEVREGQP